MLSTPNIGNDVIDLHDPEARGKSRDARFIRRVLSATEQSLLEANRTDRLLWMLWSAKEASYKVLTKLFNTRPVARALHVSPDEGASVVSRSGVVHWNAQTLRVRWDLRPDSIHCIAWWPGATQQADTSSEIRWALRHYRGAAIVPLTPREAVSARNEHSAAARQLAKDLLAQADGVANHSVEIVRHRREGSFEPPRFEIDGRTCTDWDLSISHHGSLVGAAIARRPSAGSPP